MDGLVLGKPRIEVHIFFSYQLQLTLEEARCAFEADKKVGCDAAYLEGRRFADQIVQEIPALRAELDAAEAFANRLLREHPPR